MELAPVLLENEPAGHSVNACCLLTARGWPQKPPAGQSLQAVLPDEEEYLPDSHISQSSLLLAEALLAVPGSHGMQLRLVDPPVAGVRVPGGHGVGLNVANEEQ